MQANKLTINLKDQYYYL